MVRAVVVVVLMQLVLCRTQMFDMSDGNDEGLVCPCEGGAIGNCKEEDASLYPGGPTTGFVLSTDTASSCIDVPGLITVTENSNFNMQVHVPYTQSWDSMQVVLTVDGTAGWFDWFTIKGPILENERWMEFSEPLPSEIDPGTYKVSIWDNASNNKISIRYFEITEKDLATTTTIDAESTSDSTSETIDSTTESTDSTTELTTDSTPHDSTTELSTEPIELPTEPTTTTISGLTSDPNDVTQDPPTMDPPRRESKISVWGVILGFVIGVTAMCLLICCIWFIVAGWRRRRNENKPDDMVSLPRLEVIHMSDASTNSSTIGITGRRTKNWVFR